MMFGDKDYRSHVEILLADFSFSDLLEMNDLTEEDVLDFLLEHGMLSEPQRLFQEYDEDDDYDS